MGQHGVIKNMKRHEAAMCPGERRRAKHSKVIRAKRKAEANA
jgi:hypothetical protein